MQTFLPFDSFFLSAKALDYRRLGKQRVECKQILRALMGETKGWVNHPATKMWKGHEYALCAYAYDICSEWRHRGYNDTLLPYFEDLIYELPICSNPKWLGDKAFHASHRSNLLRKDPVHYSQFGWKEPPDLPYVWP